MCGIFAIVGKENVISQLINGLQKLEYRGYDSSGIGIFSNKKISLHKATGKIINLRNKIKDLNLSSNVAISHTRWATHGKAVENNAHPHSSNNFSVVHNGIIENFKELRKELKEKGVNFVSDTDTEVIPHLIEYFYKKEQDILLSIKKTLAKLDGTFALAIISNFSQKKIFLAKKGSPLAIGKADKANYIASDAYAMSDLAKEICYLEDNDIAEISSDKITIFNKKGDICQRKSQISSNLIHIVDKGQYKHFMQKEINEQPEVIAKIINSYVNKNDNKIVFPLADLDYKNIKNISFIACGSSYYATAIAKNIFEKEAGVECRVEIASEFLYGDFISKNSDLFVFISQSGETADSLRSLEMVKKAGKKTLVITNVEYSSMARIADYKINLLAGPEIGVASTKAFTAQLLILLLLSLEIASNNQSLTEQGKKNFLQELITLPKLINQVIQAEEKIAKIAIKLKNISNIIYLGRGGAYGVAQEGALKLKELSYIHTEAIASGELKHGSIALIDENLFIVAIIPNDHLAKKTLSNMQEVNARGGKIIVITDQEIANKLEDIAEETIIIPEIGSFASSVLYTIPAQLLAYHTALFKGTDVDHPRNLAKSVTVE